MYNNKDLNYSANKMLDKIGEIIKQKLKNIPTYRAAIVSRVNPDGTVNVYFPPDKDRIFTNISNQTPFKLYEGDSVELLLKNGSFNNCWVAAKHNPSNTDRQ